jgi:phage tail sheath protein FI
MAHQPGSSNWGTAASGTTYTSLNNPWYSSLSAGANGTIAAAQIITAYGFLSNPDVVDVSLLISGPGNATVAASLITTVESRKDCLVFLSPTRASVVNNAGSESTSILSFRAGLTSSSYAVLDSGYKYQYDKYNDVYRYVPLNGDIAGVCARTDLERDPWFSPGGLNRGIIKNVIKLAYNPTKAERDNLYVQGINPVVTFQGEGTILFGDKTMLNRPSVFDRINVRRLFVVLEKSIARAARSTLFEFNDQFTRAQFVNLVEPYLRDVQGRRGITDFRVVCDTTNNTPEVIDSNRFVGDIYIKPARSVNFIQLNFVAVRTGVSFEEIVGRF